MSPDPTVPNGLVVYERPEDRRVADARARLALARQHTRRTLSALRAEVAEQADWRTWVRARPELFLGAAFLTGLFLARGSRRSR